MAGKKSDLGPSGIAVMTNVTRLRGDVSYAELARRLEKLGRPIPPLGLRRIESGDRRVDADDLVALAVALGVSPATLLMPPADNAADQVDLTGVGTTTARDAWDWLTTDKPLRADTRRQAVEWLLATQPAWMDDLINSILQPREGRT